MYWSVIVMSSRMPASVTSPSGNARSPAASSLLYQSVLVGAVSSAARRPSLAAFSKTGWVAGTHVRRPPPGHIETPAPAALRQPQPRFPGLVVACLLEGDLV